MDIDSLLPWNKNAFLECMCEKIMKTLHVADCEIILHWEIHNAAALIAFLECMCERLMENLHLADREII